VWTIGLWLGREHFLFSSMCSSECTWIVWTKKGNFRAFSVLLERTFWFDDGGNYREKMFCIVTDATRWQRERERPIMMSSMCACMYVCVGNACVIVLYCRDRNGKCFPLAKLWS